MFKAFNSKQLTNNTNNMHIILGSREKQQLLFSLVHLILCYANFMHFKEMSGYLCTLLLVLVVIVLYIIYHIFLHHLQ